MSPLEKPSIASPACTNPEPVQVPLHRIGSQSRPKLDITETDVSNIATVRTTDNSPMMEVAESSRDPRSPVSRETQPRPQRREAWSNEQPSNFTSVRPCVQSAVTQPHTLLEELTPYELSARAGNPFGLTFSDESEEEQRPSFQLAAKESQSSSKEQEMQQISRRSNVSSSENPSLSSLACTDPEPAHIPLYYIGSQSRPKLHTARSNVSNVATDPFSSRMDTVLGSLIVTGHVHSPVPCESYQNQPRGAWNDPHNTTSTHTISTGVRSAVTQPRMSVEESTPYELSARAGNPFGLTFSEEREEVQRPSFETQQLLTRLAAKENQFSSKEREMRQLSQELEDARRRNEGLIAERVGDSAGDIRAHPGAQNNFQATPIPEAGAMQTYQHSPYSTMSSSSEETSMGSASLSTVSSSENPSLPSLACTDPEPAHIPLYYVGSQNQFSSKEREMRQLSQELEDARRRNEGLIATRVGEAEVYLTSITELEELLMRKNTEVESLRVELEQLHDTQALHASLSNVNPDDLYRMDNNPHGICLIINNHKFHHPTDPSKAHPDRVGSEIDQFNLKQTFRYLRYKVEVLENLTSDQMTDTMMTMSQRDHSKFDSFVCCVLTHGEADVVHGTDSQQVPLQDLTGLMKYSKTLSGKPKMFFIQACRGETEDKGMQFDDFQKDSGGSKSVIPQGADFFYGYATPLNFAAYRSRWHGSWYISELCKVFTDNAYTDNLNNMMKKVNNNVTKAFSNEGWKQCPEVVDRLRKEVHFFHFLRRSQSSSSTSIPISLPIGLPLPTPAPPHSLLPIPTLHPHPILSYLSPPLSLPP